MPLAKVKKKKFARFWSCGTLTHWLSNLVTFPGFLVGLFTSALSTQAKKKG